MKRMLLTIATVSALSLFVTECAAQENTAGVPTTTAPKIILREGTEISLKIAQNVNSRTARQDDVVEFVLAAPLKVGDAVVADVGSRAIGTVIHSVKPNFVGDPGELTVRLTFLKVGKVKVPIRGTTLRAGDYRVVIRGSQATIKMGTPMTAYVDADVEVGLLGPGI